MRFQAFSYSSTRSSGLKIWRRGPAVSKKEPTMRPCETPMALLNSSRA